LVSVYLSERKTDPKSKITHCVCFLLRPTIAREVSLRLRHLTMFATVVTLRETVRLYSYRHQTFTIDELIYTDRSQSQIAIPNLLSHPIIYSPLISGPPLRGRLCVTARLSVCPMPAPLTDLADGNRSTPGQTYYPLCCRRTEPGGNFF